MQTDDSLQSTAKALSRHRRAFEAFTRPATRWIIEQLSATATHIVDLASGIGDPALAIAAHLRAARVTACDRVPEFLAELSAEAAARGSSNLRTLEADMAALPLTAASADCVVSRLGIQFAPDIANVVAEIWRVLRPGGATCHIVWGTPEQPLLRATVLDVLAACGGPRFAIGVPGPFQFSEPGTLGDALRRGGFNGARETTLDAVWMWPGDAASLWAFTRETSAMVFDPLLARLTAAERERLERSVLDALEHFACGAELQIPVQVHCVHATRD